MKRRLISAACALTLIAGTSGVAAVSATDASAATDTAPIVVGGEGTLSLTPGIAGGFEAGIYRFNKSGGLAGRKIKFLGFLDDGFSPSTALTNIQQLVENDHVFAVVPVNEDVAGQSFSTFLSQHHTPMIGYGVTPIFIDDKWGWSVNGDYAAGSVAQTQAFVQLAKTLHKPESQLKYAFITNSIASGADVLKIAKVALNAVGAKLVYAEANIPVSGTVSYAPFAQQIVASGANVLFNTLGTPDVIGLSAALKQAGFTGANLNGQTYLPGTLASSPNTESALQGAYVSQGFPSDEDNTPAVKQAIKDLKAVGAPPYLSNGASIGYWSAQLFISMLKATLAKTGSAAKVTPQAMYNTVNGGYTYTSALPGGQAKLTFPKAELVPNTCYGLLQIEGAGYVLKQPYSCNGQLVPVK